MEADLAAAKGQRPRLAASQLGRWATADFGNMRSPLLFAGCRAPLATARLPAYRIMYEANRVVVVA